MKKKILGGVAVIAIAALAAFNMNVDNNKQELSAIDLANVEALASGESGLGCYAGGVGSSSCSIDAGIEIIGVGIAGGCSVSCIEGYYACCSLRCTCIKS